MKAMKTKDYDKFVFRADNRAKIDHHHVERLKSSILSRNLLDMRPIIINEDWEVIDGQHRLLAARELGLDIYYQIEAAKTIDIIQLNVQKSWSYADYMNYYCKNGYKAYQDLDKFAKLKGISIQVAIALILAHNHQKHEDFRLGKLEFDETHFFADFQLCRQTIDFIKKAHGFSAWTDASKFWKALIHLFQQPEFEYKKWEFNLIRHTDKVTPKATYNQYFRTFVNIFNWRNSNPIRFEEEIS